MSSIVSTSSPLSWDKSVVDQDKLDAADKLAFQRVAAFRPGFLVYVVGPRPGGNPGAQVIGAVLNARCVTKEKGDDAVLVSTAEYGRVWFRNRGSSFRCISRAPG
jgi:hypothetical protein